jgi:hypothetical protein
MIHVLRGMIRDGFGSDQACEYQDYLVDNCGKCGPPRQAPASLPGLNSD